MALERINSELQSLERKISLLLNEHKSLKSQNHQLKDQNNVVACKHKKAMKEFYLRPRIILGLIKQIKSPNQVKSIFKRTINILK